MLIKKEKDKPIEFNKDPKYAHLFKEPYTTNLDYNKIYEK